MPSQGGELEVFKIVPRDEKFFDQIEQLAGLTKSSAAMSGELVSRFPQTDGIRGRISNAREEAARVKQESLCRLDDAFITPLDREDILQLITDLFDVVDRVSDFAQRFSLYGLKQVYPSLQDQSQTLQKITTVLVDVLGKLRHEKKLVELTPQVDEIDALVKQASADQDQFLSELFRGTPDPLEVMKKRDLHDMLENAIEDCENVTRTLGRVLLKNG